MIKSTKQTLLLIFSVLLLLVSVSVSANAQGYFVEGEIRWINRYGVVPAAPGDSRPSASPCSILSVVALDAGSKRPVAYTDQGASPFQFSFPQGVEYVCKYSLKVPEDRDLYIMATMGSVLLLPKTDRDPYLITDPWIINGGVHRPPAGGERGFAGATYVTLRSRDKKTVQTVNFEMFYVNSDKGTPDSFAGAWQAKWGDSVLLLILQQAGDRVTGQLQVNSADLGVIREGSVVGNTLRFKIVRAGRVLPNGFSLPDDFVGNGALVMGAGAKSFTGNILGLRAGGTLVGG